jgi:hypothetical protein
MYVAGAGDALNLSKHTWDTGTGDVAGENALPWISDDACYCVAHRQWSKTWQDTFHHIRVLHHVWSSCSLAWYIVGVPRSCAACSRAVRPSQMATPCLARAHCCNCCAKPAAPQEGITWRSVPIKRVRRVDQTQTVKPGHNIASNICSSQL